MTREELEVERDRLAHRDADSAYLYGVAAERAAIVAWLRRMHTYTREHDGSDNAVSLTLARTVERIERGEHRREEER